MAVLSLPASRNIACEPGIQQIQGLSVGLRNGETSPILPHQRPKSAHCDFRESRRWAKSNAEWTDYDGPYLQHSLNRRRASEDLLRSHLLPTTPVTPTTEPQSCRQGSPSDAESIAYPYSLNCLSRSLSTNTWLNLRGNSARRKTQVHHQFGRFVRRIADTTNWASKEPTESCDAPEEAEESEALRQPAPDIKRKKPIIRRVAKLSKKPRMDNIRAEKEAADRPQETSSTLISDGVINLNAIEDTPKQCERGSELCEQDVEETKRRSDDLREALNEYHSDRHGNLLPEINLDTFGDLSALARQHFDHHIGSASVAELLSGPESRSAESAQNVAWKTPSPRPSQLVTKTTLSAPQPGPRVSSRHGATGPNLVRYKDANRFARQPEAYKPGQRTPGGSRGLCLNAIAPFNVAPLNDQTLPVSCGENRSINILSICGEAPTKSTDTLTAITNEALGSNQLLAFSKSTDTEPCTLRPSVRPTKLHSGFVSAGKASGDAPNRPLPDLPEVPSPKSVDAMRRDGGSRASSRSRHSLQRASLQLRPAQRTSSSGSIVSLAGVLQVTNSPHASPHRAGSSVKKSRSGRSFSPRRPNGQSNRTNAASPELVSVEKDSENGSPYLGQSRHFATTIPSQKVLDTLSRDQRIHDKRLKDIAFARAKRSTRRAQDPHQSTHDDPAAEDFPSPPSSRTPSRATIDCQRCDSRDRSPAANAPIADASKASIRRRSETEDLGFICDTPTQEDSVQEPQAGTVANSSHDASLVPALAPTQLFMPVSGVIDKSKKQPRLEMKHSQGSLRSNVTIAQSRAIVETQTPPLSECSTPSSDEDGTGVMGTASASDYKIQKRIQLYSGELSSLVSEICALKDQLDTQTHRIQAQSKQIRAIETQKRRMADTVNALAEIVGHHNNVRLSGTSQGRERDIPLKRVNLHLSSSSRRKRESVESTSNTIASCFSVSSESGSSHLTFITESDILGNEMNCSIGRETVEFSLDFDRMQELIRLDRKPIQLGPRLEGKASRRRRNGSAVGYLSISA